ncbi:MAG: hypothetical protein HZC28_15950 [Spirochaetes bacterium]|nr:hypothetical protein [Spirochaetota bacterium]
MKAVVWVCLSALFLASCASDPMRRFGPEGLVGDTRLRVIGVGKASSIENRDKRRQMAKEAALMVAKDKLARMVTELIMPESPKLREEIARSVPGAMIIECEWADDDTCYILYEVSSESFKKLQHRKK